MNARFELFDHTADIGIRIFAPSLEELIRPATDALYAVIGELAACGPAEIIKLDFKEEDAPSLLRSYLAELLRLFETSNWMISKPEVAEFNATHLRVSASKLHV